VLELKLWYEASTDEEKIQIAQILIVSLKGAGYRFLEEINDGVWHELTNNEAREMAKHALEGYPTEDFLEEMNSGVWREMIFVDDDDDDDEM
jgi:hypothetical protein